MSIFQYSNFPPENNNKKFISYNNNVIKNKQRYNIIHCCINLNQKKEIKLLKDFFRKTKKIVTDVANIAQQYDKSSPDEQLQMGGKRKVLTKGLKKGFEDPIDTQTFTERYIDNQYPYIPKKYRHYWSRTLGKGFIKRYKKHKNNYELIKFYNQLYIQEASISKINNQYYLIIPIHDGIIIKLELIIFERFKKRMDDLLSNDKITYNVRILKQAYKQKYHINIDFMSEIKQDDNEINNGVISVDFNMNHLSVDLLDKNGNIVWYRNINHKLNEKNYGRKEEEMNRLARKLYRLAVKYDCPIAMENLNHKQGSKIKQAFVHFAKTLKNNMTQYASNPYRNPKENNKIVDVYLVPSEYSSKIGALNHNNLLKKYPHITEGQSAAYIIGKRALAMFVDYHNKEESSSIQEELFDITYKQKSYEYKLKKDGKPSKSKKSIFIEKQIPKWILEIYTENILTKTMDEDVKNFFMDRKLSENDKPKFSDTFPKWKLITIPKQSKSDGKVEYKYMINKHLQNFIDKIEIKMQQNINYILENDENKTTISNYMTDFIESHISIILENKLNSKAA